MNWLKPYKDGVLICVHVVPNASSTEIVGTFGDRLKIKVSSPPVDGNTNAELLLFLKETLQIKSNEIELLRGTTSRQKDILVLNISIEAIQKSLL